MSARSIHDAHAKLSIHRAMEVRREEYLDNMTFRSTRPLFTEIFGPLVGLKEEWVAQGATPQELDLSAFRFRRPMFAAVPVSLRWMGGTPEEILEETDAHIISRDHMGRRIMLCKGSATVPLPLDYPVRTMDDWRNIKHHYEFSEERFRTDWERKAREAREAGHVVTLRLPGGFDEPRQLMGEENICLAFHEQPELIHDILDTIGGMAARVVERVVASGVQVDELNVHEDMAGKSGPLAGPRQVKEFIAPYYRRVWNPLQAAGARTFSQDSDGNMDAVIPAFLDGGVNIMYPMEPAAGMDIVKTRAQYGKRLAFWGGIDKHVLRRSKEEIAAEMEYKIPPMMRTGGCLIGLDHRIPNGTPLENYRFYIQKAWEIMERTA